MPVGIYKRNQETIERLKKMGFQKGQNLGYTPWNKGKKGIFSEETRKKWREARKGEKNHFYGKRHTKEAKAKMSGENNGNWKGGVSSEYHLIRESSDYKLWREAV